MNDAELRHTFQRAQRLRPIFRRAPDALACDAQGDEAEKMNLRLTRKALETKGIAGVMLGYVRLMGALQYPPPGRHRQLPHSPGASGRAAIARPRPPGGTPVPRFTLRFQEWFSAAKRSFRPPVWTVNFKDRSQPTSSFSLFFQYWSPH